MKNNQSGRSMIEMLGVLAIIGVLSVGGIAGYSKAMSKYRINKTIDQVTMLVTNLRTLYAQQTNYAGLNNQVAIDMGAVPEEMLLANQAGTGTTSEDTAATQDLRNAFQGMVYVGPGKARTDDNVKNGALVVTFTGLTKEACAAMATGDWGSGTSSGFIGIAVASDATTLKGTDGQADDLSGLIIGQAAPEVTHGKAATAGKGPMSVVDASAGCKCSGPTCAVMWKYY